MLETRWRTPYHYDLFQGDVGHTLVLGATGAGKSFSLNFLLVQELQYDPRVLILDLGGQRPRNNNFMVEGVDNNDKGVTGRVVNVPNEAVAEWALSSVRAVPSNITRNNLIPGHPVFNRPDQVYDSHAREIHLVLRFTF